MSIKVSCHPGSKHSPAFVLVNHHVTPETADGGEGEVAPMTPVGILPGVTLHVDLQVPLPSEVLHALVTPVGLLPGVSPHVELQAAAPSEVPHALVTPVGLLPGVNPHVELQVVSPAEALHALLTPVGLLLGLLAGVGPHVDGQLGIVGKHLATQGTGPALAVALMFSLLLRVGQLLAAVQAVVHTVVHGQRAQGLQIGEEGVMAVHHQFPPPLCVDTQDVQLPVVTGQVGGARGVRVQTIRGGVVLSAAVSNVIAVFC